MTQHHVFNLSHRVTAQIEIDASIDQVFSYVTDPNNHIHWLGSVSDVHDVSGSPGVGQQELAPSGMLRADIIAVGPVGAAL